MQPQQTPMLITIEVRVLIDIIKSLESECAYFKARGFKFIELGLDAPYKREFDGYEIMGPA